MTTNRYPQSNGSPLEDRGAAASGQGDAAQTEADQPMPDAVDPDAVDQVLELEPEVSPVAAAVESKSSQADQLQRQLTSAEERVLAHAELENYRKRANRLLEEERKYAPLPLVQDLLPVVDENLERAIRSADQSGGSAGLLEGVKMVAQLLHSVLDRHHCQRIEAEGAPFDPHLHQAIAQLPRDDVPPGTVIDVAVSGYVLHDRVVRPAQVLVSMRSPVPEPGSGKSEG